MRQRLHLVVALLFCLVALSIGLTEDYDLSATTLEAMVDNAPQRRVRFDRLTLNDVCENEPGVYGECDTSRFPTCNSGEDLCFNRRPRRDKFWQDIRQPYYYIDYRNVLCYPTTYAICSSCSPGRLCWSEQRCIFEDIKYTNCTEWW